MARITIASLTEQLRIAETKLIEQGRTIEALRTQVAMLKPVDGGTQLKLISDSTGASTAPPDVVIMRGEPCYKLKHMVGGRLITTYRPVARGLETS